MTHHNAPAAIEQIRPGRAGGPFAAAARRVWRAPAQRSLLAAAVAATLLATAGAASLASAKAGLSSVALTCMQVSAVLSDGPDPGADPVGYAQAQILPLRQVHTPDKALQQAIDDLASAYQTFVRDHGKGQADHRAVNAAAKQLDAICPGATS